MAHTLPRLFVFEFQPHCDLLEIHGTPFYGHSKKAKLANPLPNATMADMFCKNHFMATVSKSQVGQSISQCHYGIYMLQTPFLWPIVQKAILVNYVFAQG